MPIDPTDIAKAEFDALRAEIVSRNQAAGTIVTGALTLVAAIGGFALAKDGSEEMLLVLPLALSALGVLLVEGTHANRRIAYYFREYLWARLPAAECAAEEPASWEHFIDTFRAENQKRPSFHLLGGTLPIFLILVIPSVAAIVLTEDEAVDSLWWLWLAGIVSLAVFVLMSLTLLFPSVPGRARKSGD